MNPARSTVKFELLERQYILNEDNQISGVGHDDSNPLLKIAFDSVVLTHVPSVESLQKMADFLGDKIKILSDEPADEPASDVE